jgi:choline dehydrogenase-like flavoprotein
VQFKATSNTGSTFTASARREVILAAGSVQTSQLLQLSGIGDPTDLQPLGIDVKVNLRTVGRNLQEQSLTALGHPATGGFNPGGRGPNDVIAYPNIDQLFSASAGGNGTAQGNAAAVKQWVQGSVGEWARKEAINGLSEEALRTIFNIQAGYIVNGSAPIAEIFFSMGYPA